MSDISSKPRRRLFHRLENDLPPLQITRRDLRILELVGDYRFLDTRQIRALVGGSKHNVTERLSRLFHHAYLDRPSHQRELRSEGYRFIVYALAPKGARLLATELGKNVRVSRHLAEDNRTVKRFYLAHTLMVSQFRACLTLACRERTDIELVEWRVPERPLARVVLGGRRVAVIPDAHFALRAEDGLIAHFFVEADRGTMSHRRFLSKLQAYWRLRSRGEDSGIPRAFRVLTIATSNRRMENLLTTAIHADPRKMGSAMYCFTVESSYSLEDPQGVFGCIWRSPGDQVKRSILDRRREAHE